MGSVKKCKTLFALAVAALAVVSGAADNLVIPEGARETISGTQTYDEIFVNGELTILANAKVAASRLIVASNMTDKASVAKLVMEDASSVTVSANDQYGTGCILGYDGRAAVTLNGTASFKTGSGSLCWKPTNLLEDKVVLTLNDKSTFAVTGSRFTVMRGTPTGIKDPNVGLIHSRIVLNGSSAFSAKIIHRNGDYVGLGIVFNGGRLKADATYGGGFLGSYGNKSMTLLESKNGNPCIIELASSKVKTIFDADADKTGCFKTAGSGSLVICGAYSAPLFSANAVTGAADRHNWGAADLYVQSGTTISLLADMTLPTTGALKLPVGATLELNGFDLTVGGAFVAGDVTNASGEQDVSTLTVGNGGGNVTFAHVPAVGIKVVKAGSGALSIPDGAVDSVEIDAGDVEFCNRRDVGYPYYRFWVDTRRANVRLGEFAMYSDREGSVDETGKWTMLSHVTEGGFTTKDLPTGMVDRVDGTMWVDKSWGETTDWRTNRAYVVFHFGGAPTFNHSFSDHEDVAPSTYLNAAADEFPADLCVPVSSYRLQSAEIPSGKWYHPKTWRFQGAMRGNEWRDLDVVRNAEDTQTSWKWMSLHVFDWPTNELHVANLKIADGTKWSLDLSQSAVSIDTLDAGENVTIVLTNGVLRTGALPIRVTSLAQGSGLKGWKAVCGSEPPRSVIYEGGMLAVAPKGFVLIFR